MYQSKAPVRIDFAGGTTDISPFCDLEGGAVVSASINLYAHASLVKIPSEGVDVSSHRGGEIRLHSLDYDKFIEAKDIRELEYDGNLDLVKAALRRLNIPSGMELRLQSDAPPGSGLGSSAAMGVALLGLLNEAFSLGLTKAQIAELEFTLETEELGITGGRQDQYAAAFGGINFMTFTSDGVFITPLDLNDKIKRDLEKRLILCYTGHSRLSGDVNRKMIGKYMKGVPAVQRALRNIKQIAQEIRDVLELRCHRVRRLEHTGEASARGRPVEAWHRAPCDSTAGKLDDLGELFDAELKNRRILTPEVMTAKMENLSYVASGFGASSKICGAGGGGCMLFYVKEKARQQVIESLEKAGGQIISFLFENEGLQVIRKEASAARC